MPVKLFVFITTIYEIFVDTFSYILFNVQREKLEKDTFIKMRNMLYGTTQVLQSFRVKGNGFDRVISHSQSTRAHELMI